MKREECTKMRFTECRTDQLKMFHAGKVEDLFFLKKKEDRVMTACMASVHLKVLCATVTSTLGCLSLT